MGALEIRVATIQVRREKTRYRQKSVIRERELEELLTEIENLATITYNIAYKNKRAADDFCMQTQQIMLMIVIAIRKYLGYEVSRELEKKMEESYYLCKKIGSK